MSFKSSIIEGDCILELPNIESNSINCILIDPPYLISRNSGFSSNSKDANIDIIRKYGNISIDFGDWDKGEIDWDFIFKQFSRILVKGGTLIIFYDIWKSSEIKFYADKYKFKQPRVCQWQKTNPVPINSKRNYLSNSIEYFFTFIKGKNPTFNSEYDNGVYRYPICGGKERYDHTTQKPLALINELVLKHTNENDIILDCFAGTGTTAHSCILNNRKYIIIENNTKYFNIIKKRIDSIKQS